MEKKGAVEERIASILLSIGAVSLNPASPYTWASGLKSPIYCDNRLLMGYPAARAAVTEGFMDLLTARSLKYDVLAGTATAGIPHAAWLAQVTEMPMVYVRSKPKGHGRQNQIEGPLEAGQSVVVIEDLISTGKSSVAAVRALQEAGAEVKHVLAIFSYGFQDATNMFEDAGVPFDTLTNFETLIMVAEREGRLPAAELETMRAWRVNPRKWSETL